MKASWENVECDTHLACISDVSDHAVMGRASLTQPFREQESHDASPKLFFAIEDNICANVDAYRCSTFRGGVHGLCSASVRVTGVS